MVHTRRTPFCLSVVLSKLLTITGLSRILLPRACHVQYYLPFQSTICTIINNFKAIVPVCLEQPYLDHGAAWVGYDVMMKNIAQGK